MSNKKVSLLLDVSRGVFIYGLTVPNTTVSMPALVTGDTYDIELSLVKKANNESNTSPIAAGSYSGVRLAIMSSVYTATSGQYKIVFGQQESPFIDFNVTASEFATELNTLVKAHFNITDTANYVTVSDSINKDAFIVQYDELLPSDCTDLLSAAGDSLMPKCLSFVAKISAANNYHKGVVAFQMKRRPVAYVDLTEANYYLNDNTEYARKPFIGVLSLNTQEMASHIFGSANGTSYLVEIELIATGGGRETVMQDDVTLNRDYIVEGAYYTDPIGVQSLGQNIYDALDNANTPTGANPFATMDDIPTALPTEWGDITGNITSQTDLASALATLTAQKYNASNPAGYIDGSYLNGYATESWVQSQGYINDLTGYATETFVTSQGYIDVSYLTGYATETWVQQQGYGNNTTIETTVTESSSNVTVSMSDANTVIRVTSPITVFLGDDTNNPFPIGAQVVVVNLSSGTVAFASTGLSSVNSPSGLLNITAQYGTAVAIKINANQWVLSGNLS